MSVKVVHMSEHLRCSYRHKYKIIFTLKEKLKSISLGYKTKKSQPR
jgi:hypothetical protein